MEHTNVAGVQQSTSSMNEMQGTSVYHEADDKLSSNGREARNRAEKNRRDKIGGYVQNLSTLIPYVRESPRRVDKTAILRLATHGMRINYVFGKSTDPRPKNLNDTLSDALLRMLDTFLLTITIRGQITLVSSEVETYLGHCQSDLYGRSILSIAHPDDHAFLRRQIIPKNLERLFDIQPHSEQGQPCIRTKEEEDIIDQKLRDDKRKFTFRIARAGPRSEPITYEMVRVDGCFRRADLAPRGLKESTFPSGLQLVRRSRGKDDSIPLHTISSNDIVFVAMVHVIKPPSICDRLFEATKFEYMTRHLIDGRIVQCDQRISVVAGYMADEVCGLSPFSFMHKSDVRWVMVALRQMYDCSYKFGESCYRLIASNGEFIYLRTHGYLDINDENQVGSFVCRNTLVSEEEGRALIQKMKNRFVIMIRQEQNALIIDSDTPVEGPVQLERAIMRLIMKLPHSSSDSSLYEPSLSYASPPIQSFGSDNSEIGGRSLGSPLAYITPTIDTIRGSIDRSVRIIEISTRQHSESEDDAPGGSQGTSSATSNASDNTRTSSVKEQLLIFRTSNKRKTDSVASSSVHMDYQDCSSQPQEEFSEQLLTEQTSQSPEETLRPKNEATSSSGGFFNKKSFDMNRPQSSRYTNHARLPNPVDNKHRDFCSTVGGFNYNSHAFSHQHSQMFPSSINQSTVRASPKLKRTHSFEDMHSSALSSSDTFRHSANRYSPNSKIFVTNNPRTGHILDGAHPADISLCHKIENDKVSTQNPGQFKDLAVDYHMDDGGTSDFSHTLTSSGCRNVDSFGQNFELNQGICSADNESFKMASEAYIKTENLLEPLFNVKNEFEVTFMKTLDASTFDEDEIQPSGNLMLHTTSSSRSRSLQPDSAYE